jgi:hypothetical protein
MVRHLSEQTDEDFEKQLSTNTIISSVIESKYGAAGLIDSDSEYDEEAIKYRRCCGRHSRWWLFGLC